METVWKLAGICLVALLASPLLRRGDLALLAPLAAVIVGGALVLAAASELSGVVTRLVGMTSIPSALFVPLLKAVLIGAISRIAGALCADAGQGALKALLDLGGTVCALLAALPLLEAFLAVLEGWL